MNRLRKPIRYQQMVVRRAPGFPGGMDPLQNLDASVVIITGANGSGKSTTARVIQEVLSPEKRSETEFTCSFDKDGELWTVEKSAGQTKWLRNGENAEPDFLPSAAHRSHYMFAMHDLLLSEDTDLARVIYDASIGGFNIEQASKDLKYSGVGNNTRITEFNQYTELEKAAQKAKDDHRLVKEREANLKSLEQKRQEGIKARVYRDYYSRVLQWVDKKNEYRLAEDTLNTFSDNIKYVQEGDTERCRSLQKRIEELHNKIKQVELEIQTLESQRSVLRNTDPEQVEKDRRLLNQLHASYESITSEKNRQMEQIEAKVAEIEALKRYVGDPVVGDNSPDLVKLEMLYRKCLSAEEQLNLLLTRITHYQAEVSKELNHTTSELTEGILSLSAWLREPAQPKPTKVSFWPWVLASLALVAGLAGWLIGLPAVIIGLAAFILAWLVKRHQNTQLTTQPGEHRRQDYQNSKLPQPETWSVSEVTKLLTELQHSLQSAHQKQKSEEQLSEAQRQYKMVESTLHVDRKQLMSFGESCGLDTSQIQDPGSLYQFMRYYANLITASASLSGYRASVEHTNAKLSEVQANLTKVFASYSRPEHFSNTDRLIAEIHTLAEEMQTYLKASAELRHKTDISRRYKDDIDQAERELEELLKRTGLTPEQSSLLAELESVKPSYLNATLNFSSLDRQLNQLKKDITEDPAFEHHTIDFNSIDLEQIKQKIEHYNVVLSDYDAIVEEIGGINADVRKLMQGNNLENVLTRSEEARDQIKVAYHTKLRSVLGNTLVNELQQELGKTSVPEVMHSARQLFSRITNGRYQLEITNKGSDGFKAFDSLTRSFKFLAELSSGTRIQLLLSVRLAFLEVQEKHVKYPLLADELLANSDDIRAEAVIDTLLNVAENGRQVFYFTAQSDEISKWQHKFKDSVSTRVIALGEDMKSTFISVKKPSVPLLHRKLPDAALSYDAYLQELNPPKFDLIYDEPDSIQLVYVVTETKLLHAFLTNHINYWSQLQNLIQSGNTPNYLDDENVRYIMLRVMAIKEAAELIRIGRPRPIGYREIEESGAVSPTFMSQVIDLLQLECDHNPEVLIARLRDKAVSNFKQTKIDQLEEFLLDGGYLTSEQPLNNDEYRQRMSQWLQRNEISFDEFDQLMERISENVKVGKP
ncbi:MAG: hypothetical protein JJU41_00890 [Bacteroidetes bacterium]|nr:hypothetical protein [Bacteroidota bacterium]